MILLVAAAFASDPANRPIEVALPGNVEVDGWLRYATEQCIVIATKEELVGIPPQLVQSVRTTEATLSGDEFLRWAVSQNQSEEEDVVPEPMLLAASASIWAGMPYLLMDDWPGVKGAAIMEGLLFGGLLYGLFLQESMVLVLPFGASVVSLRAWVARDVYIEARRLNSVPDGESLTFTLCPDANLPEKR